MSSSPANLVARFIDIGDEESVQYVRAALAVWRRRKDVPLHRALRIGPTPHSLDLAQRDAYLLAASSQLAGKPAERARELHALARRFELRNWPSWCRRGDTPDGCSPVLRHLFDAMQTGVPLPTTRRQFLNIIRAGNESS